MIQFTEDEIKEFIKRAEGLVVHRARKWGLKLSLEEISDTANMAVAECLSTYNPEKSSFSTWLYWGVMHPIHTLIRTNVKHKDLSFAEELTPDLRIANDDSVLEARSILRAWWNRLNPAQKRWALDWFRTENSRRIARELGKGRSTIIHRKMKLKKILKQVANS